MAKQSGLGDNFFVAGYNVSGDIQQLGTISTTLAVLPTTGIDKSAMERVGSHRDAVLEFNTFFNDADDQIHEALSGLPRTDAHFYYARGTTLGNPAFAMVGKQINYDLSRPDDASLTFGVAANANSFGGDWGRQMTAGVRSDALATNGASVDFGTGSTAFGLQAYLQVFSFTGTSCTVKIQESSDNAVGDPFVDVTGGGFTAATGRTFERIQTARALTVERYLRVVTTGTFSQCSFAVMINRNPLTVNF